MSEPVLGSQLPSPEFPETISTRTADAVIRLFAEDVAIRSYCTGGVEGFEHEDLLLATDAEYTLFTPMIAVFLDGWEQRRAGSNRQAMRTTLVRFGLVRGRGQAARGNHWLGNRLLDHATRLLYTAGAAQGGAGGILYDTDGVQLTEGYEVIQRVPRPRLLPGPERLLITLVDALFRRVIREDTGEPA